MRKMYYADSNDGRFLEWFCNGLNTNGLTCKSLAEKLNVHKMTISGIVTKRNKPTKTMIVAMCWAFGMKDDPEDIWKIVEEDWA